MSTVRIALANLAFPSSPEDSVGRAERAIDAAARAGALVVCFPESDVPGYRAPGKGVPPPDRDFLEHAWTSVATAAAAARITVVLGTERLVDDGLRISCVVANPDGSVASSGRSSPPGR